MSIAHLTQQGNTVTEHCNNLTVQDTLTTNILNVNKLTSKSLNLTNTTNQIIFGPTGSSNTIFNANMPAGSTQIISIPDSGVSSTPIILRDTTGPQTIASELTLVGQAYPLTLGNSISGHLDFIQVITPATASQVISIPDSGIVGATGTQFILKDSVVNPQIINTNTKFNNGLTFDGTNTLSTYVQRATWTPSITVGGTTATISQTNQAYYTQLGPLVFCFFDVTISNLNSGVGNVVIHGLPIAAANFVQFTNLSSWTAITLASSYTIIYARPDASATTVTLFQAGSAATVINIDNTSLSAGSSRFNGTIMYWAL